MTDKTVVVPVELLNQVRKVCSWRLLMSYNESYFGEPEGELKAAIAAIERLMPIDAAPTPPAEYVQTAMVLEHEGRSFTVPGWIGPHIAELLAKDSTPAGQGADYQRGFNDGYERRHLEVLGALT